MGIFESIGNIGKDVGNFLGIGSGKKYNRRYNEARNEFNEQKIDVESILDRITNRSNSAYNDAESGGMTVNERYGESIDRVEDSVANDRAGAQRSITRALMTGGGDITGEGASALNKVTESGNNAISEAIRGYSDANVSTNESSRRFDLSRGDNLVSRELAGNQDLMNMTLGQMLDAQNLDIQRKTANKQLLADYIGSIAGVAGKGM